MPTLSEPTLSEIVEAIRPVFASHDLPSCWLRVYTHDSGEPTFEVGQIDDIYGWRAPSECAALVVVAPATAHTVVAGTGGRSGQRGHLICGMSRSGEVLSRLDFADGSSIDEPPGSGRLLDAMRRTFRLRTPPPDEGTQRYFTFLWLSAILRAPKGTIECWSDVALLHPVVASLVGSGTAIPDGDLDRVIIHSAMGWPWRRLRRIVIEQDPDADSDAIMDGRLAAWMDEGMFARSVLADLPPLAPLAIDAMSALPTTQRDRLVDLLERVGVLPPGDVGGVRTSARCPRRAG